MTIEVIPHYRSGDGRLFTNIDEAIAAEQANMIFGLLFVRRHTLALPLDQLIKMAAAICTIHPEIAGVFSKDLRPVVGAAGLLDGLESE